MQSSTQVLTRLRPTSRAGMIQANAQEVRDLISQLSDLEDQKSPQAKRVEEQILGALEPGLYEGFFDDEPGSKQNVYKVWRTLRLPNSRPHAHAFAVELQLLDNDGELVEPKKRIDLLQFLNGQFRISQKYTEGADYSGPRFWPYEQAA